MLKNKILRNVFTLNIFNVMNILIPLITYPLVIKGIGLSGYGYCAYIISIYTILSSFCEYSFAYTGPRELNLIATNDKKNELIINIIYSRLSIYFLIIPIVSIVAIISTKYRFDEILIISLLPLSDCFKTSWIYICYNKTKYILLSSLISKVLFLTLILTLKISQTMNEIQYLLVFVVSNIVFVMIQFLCVSKLLEIKIIKFRLSSVIFLLKSEFSVFLGRCISGLKDKTIIVWLGFFSGSEVIAVIDIFQKILNIALSPIYSISIILLPNLAKYEKYNKTSLLLKVCGFGFLALSIICIISKYLVFIPLLYLGGAALLIYQNSLFIFMLSVPFLFISSISGTCYLILKKKNFHFNISILASIITLIAGLFICKFINYRVSILDISIIFTLSAIVESGYRICFVIRDYLYE